MSEVSKIIIQHVNINKFESVFKVGNWIIKLCIIVLESFKVNYYVHYSFFLCYCTKVFMS